MSDSLPSLLEQRFELMKAVFQSDGEIESELEVLIKENSLSLADKIDRVALFLKLAPKQADLLRGEANELLGCARSMEDRIDRLKGFMKHSMTLYGNNELIGNSWRLCLQGSSGSLKLREGVSILDDIPERFVRVETKIDLKAVKSEWETLPDEVKKHFIFEEGKTLVPRPQTKRKIK